MYCRICGNKKDTIGVYCSHDGVAVLEKVFFKPKNKSSKFCATCGTECMNKGNYCGTCGSVIKQSTVSTANKIENVSIPKINIQPLKLGSYPLEYMKKALFSLILVLSLLTVVSFITIKDMEKQIEQVAGFEIDEIQDQVEYMFGSDIPKVKNIFNVPDVMMISNLQLPKVEGSVKSEWENVKFKGSLSGAFSLASILVMIFLFISGIFHGQLMKKTNGSTLKAILAFSGMYSVSISLLSFFAGFSMSSKLDGAFISGKIGYPLLPTLITTFILAFIFHGIGYLFSANYKQSTGRLTDMIPYGEAIHQSFSTILRGSVVLFAAIFGFSMYKLNELKELLTQFGDFDQFADLLRESVTFVLSFALQISQFIYSIAHFGTFTFSMQDEYDKGSIVYSLVSGIDYLDGAKEIQNMVTEFMIYTPDVDFSNIRYLLWAIVLLFAALFVWSGYKIGQKTDGAILNIGIYSVCYGVLVSMLVMVTKVGFEWTMTEDGDSEKILLYLGFGVVGMLLRSTIFSFVFAYLGAKIARRN